MDTQLLEPGSEVRLKTDPGRKGTITNTPPRQQADYYKYRVQFADGKFWLSEFDLELVGTDETDPFALIEAGKYGRPEDLRRSLTHIQLSGRLANLVYSMDATNTDFYAYQYKPVLSFLESPSNGLLIADEVGLGKTIEAGLIWTELRARQDARRLLVLCPAMLREKWQTELSQRFGVDAEICNAAELLRILKSPKRRTPEGKAYICSMQGLRPPRGWSDSKEGVSGPQEELARFLRSMDVEESLIDLTIIDEAHYLRNSESQTSKLGVLIRGVSDHLVLLSATPINLHSSDLFNLLKLVDPEAFDDESMFPQVLSANEPIQNAYRLALDVRSSASEILVELSNAMEHEVLSGSVQLQEMLSKGISDDELDEAGRVDLADRIGRINLLSHAVTRTRKAEVKEFRVLREAIPEFVALPVDGPEEKFYKLVTQEIRRYATSRGIGTGFLLATPQRQVSSCMYAAAKAWRSRGSGFDPGEIYDDLGFPDGDFLGTEMSPLIEHLRATVLPEIDIEELRRVDTKYKRLREVLNEFFADHPDEKVVLFTYFRDCVDYLHERLREEGITSMKLMGGQGVTKQDIINKFESDSDVRVLISTEVASEGVDLQFSRFLVNYDLPWNPMRVEQRIGRLDRIGQQAEKIQIWNLFHRGTIDERIYSRLLDRLKVFVRALGGMEAVLGDEIAALTSELLSRELSEEEEQQQIEQTAMAVERIRRDQDDLENQASHLIAHGGFILRQVQAAHDFKRRITSEDLMNYVQDYLEKFSPGHTFQSRAGEENGFDIRLSPDQCVKLESFLKANNLLGQTRLATNERVPCVFKNKVRQPRERREVLSQFHPLVRFIASEINESDEKFYPLTAIRIPKGAVEGLDPGRYVYVVERWSFDGIKTEEALKVIAVKFDGQQLGPQRSWELVNAGRLSGQPWTSAGSEIATNEALRLVNQCELRIRGLFEEEARKRKAENDDRVEFQRVSATRFRNRQLEMNQRILDEHRARGRTRLIAPLEGKIRKVHERFDLRISQLELDRNLAALSQNVCIGILEAE